MGGIDYLHSFRFQFEAVLYNWFKTSGYGNFEKFHLLVIESDDKFVI